jgi:hypothetical protein
VQARAAECISLSHDIHPAGSPSSLSRLERSRQAIQIATKTASRMTTFFIQRPSAPASFKTMSRYPHQPFNLRFQYLVALGQRRRNVGSFERCGICCAQFGGLEDEAREFQNRRHPQPFSILPLGVAME